ncbi:MAG TPA: penicillin acylase family protein, partial [Longimicrobiales bacterium]
YTNLSAVLDSAHYPPSFSRPYLGLRSQHALQLIGGRDKLSLEDVIARKHSMRMLLADRVKADLLSAVAATNPAGDVAAAAELLQRWDNTAAAESRGAVLFEAWWTRYMQVDPRVRGQRREALLFQRPWSEQDPTGTPSGLADFTRAAAAFAQAVAETKQKYGAFDVAWGDVHRVRLGTVDEPVGGCGGNLGCFRVLWFTPSEDGKQLAFGGDGWILAVEFGKVPRAYSVLSYGESNKPDSPHYSDQAALFARGVLKPVHFTQQDVERNTVRRYHPGLQ